jgi:hypothetical protein
MEIWTSQNNPRAQTALALGCSVVGLVLVIGFRGFEGFAMSNAMAGFLLGLLLLIIGVAAFMAGGRQTVVVDPHARLITVEDVGRFGIKKRTIRFDEVTHVGIGYLGKASNLVTFYYLLLKLDSGAEYALFAPGRFFPGASDRSTVEGWRQRLETCLGDQGLLR